MKMLHAASVLLAATAIPAASVQAQTNTQPAEQNVRTGQAAQGDTCRQQLAAFSDRLGQDQFWVTGWGTRWGAQNTPGVGAPMTPGVTPADPNMAATDRRDPNNPGATATSQSDRTTAQRTANDGATGPPAADGTARQQTAARATEDRATGRAAGADGMADGRAPWSAAQTVVGSPRYQIRQLYGAANVLAVRGEEDGCRYVMSLVDNIYADYRQQLQQAGVDPQQVTDWRQEQLALAQPIEGQNDESGRQIPLDEITGTDVRNPQDEYLGSVSDVVIDAQSGEVAYAILARGGFLGIGEDHVAVPWDNFRATAGLNTLVLNVDENRLADAPTIDTDRSSLTGRTADEVDRFWSDLGGDDASRDAS